jgi:hypothetical protein
VTDQVDTTDSPKGSPTAGQTNRHARRAAAAHGGAKVPRDRKARAQRLARYLEGEIAATADQRVVLLKALNSSGIEEPHRDHHAYHLGADAHYCGLASGDALAMMGLLSTGPANVGRLLVEAAKAIPNIYVGRLWPRLIDANRDEYEARGRHVAWQRRWAAYKVDHDSWVASLADATDDWRARAMTSGQRHLVRDTAVLLDIDIPQGMTRGAAHDWLTRHGANIVYRKQAVR